MKEELWKSEPIKAMNVLSTQPNINLNPTVAEMALLSFFSWPLCSIASHQQEQFDQLTEKIE